MALSSAPSFDELVEMMKGARASSARLEELVESVDGYYALCVRLVIDALADVIVPLKSDGLEHWDEAWEFLNSEWGQLIGWYARLPYGNLPEVLAHYREDIMKVREAVAARRAS